MVIALFCNSLPNAKIERINSRKFLIFISPNCFYLSDIAN